MIICLPFFFLSLYLFVLFQMFSDYQTQQMTDDLVDQFGFNDGEEAAG